MRIRNLKVDSRTLSERALHDVVASATSTTATEARREDDEECGETIEDVEPHEEEERNRTTRLSRPTINILERMRQDRERNYVS